MLIIIVLYLRQMYGMTKQDRMRRARKDLGLTQKEVADGVSVSVETYRKWERYSEPKTLDMTARVCKFLSIDVHYYVTGIRLVALLEDELGLINSFRSLSTKKQNALLELLEDRPKKR